MVKICLRTISMFWRCFSLSGIATSLQFNNSLLYRLEWTLSSNNSLLFFKYVSHPKYGYISFVQLASWRNFKSNLIFGILILPLSHDSASSTILFSIQSYFSFLTTSIYISTRMSSNIFLTSTYASLILPFFKSVSIESKVPSMAEYTYEA